MRPLRLELKGFTAFRADQSIDFSSLDLFAISGPTGSGKTSILDAMTYALFGTVDRVGKQAAQFISQGQPRLAVTLEFAVGQERFRVTRSTPVKGQTKILLERADGAGWTQAGEGADRVREVDSRIRQAIGLDYDAFTRTVLLPQGRFAEFLVGDARKRREILTDLLGLELFERLARRAGEVKREASLAAEVRGGLLQTEYAGVTPDAVRDAERAAKEAAAADARAADVERAVRELADRWSETARSVDDLRACSVEASRLGASAAEAAGSIAALVADLVEAETVAKAATAAGAAAEAAARKATRALGRAREAWGSAGELGALRAKAEALTERRERLAEVGVELEAAAAAIPALREVLEAAEQLLAVRVADVEAAIQAVGAAREAEERAAHADHVAAVRSGLRVGDDCPVCGARIASLPTADGQDALDRARSGRETAEAAAQQMDDAMRQAASSREAAERRVHELEADVARVRTELARVRKEAATLEAAIESALGDDVPPDPVAAVADRLRRLEELDSACDTASRAAREATDGAAVAERDLNDLRGQLAEVRAAVEALPVASVADRAAALLSSEGVSTTPRRPGTKDAAALSRFASRTSQRMTELAEALAAAAEDRSAGEAAVLEEAERILDGLVPPEAGLARLVESVSGARTAAARAAATAEQRAEDLRAKLVNAERLLEEAAGHRARAVRFDALAKELRADRIVAFLQVEALELLAAAGSRGLGTLSSGRYRLEFVDDEFSVVDTWNGEERRSARTLSGGETFLASLALALGLSEQVRALAVSDHARLDALFLDEGFGSLDPETLEVVVDAIEQLGGDGRMVGVITHVRELAMRLPARIEVEKSPRGSAIRVVTETAPEPVG